MLTSGKLFIRWLLAFVLVLFLTVIYFYFTAGLYRRHIELVAFPGGWKFIGASIVSLALFSIPLALIDYKDQAPAFGALVGLVVYGTANAVLVALDVADIPITLLDTCVGIVLGAFVAWVVQRAVPLTNPTSSTHLEVFDSKLFARR